MPELESPRTELPGFVRIWARRHIADRVVVDASGQTRTLADREIGFVGHPPNSASVLCECRSVSVVLSPRRFRLVDRGFVVYHLGQCGDCRAIHWAEGG